LDGYADIVSKIKGDEFPDLSDKARKNAAYYAQKVIASLEADQNGHED